MIIAAGLLASCDFLEPEADNTREEGILDEGAYFCGPLNTAYVNLPQTFDLEMDALTDNAVIRNFSGEYYKGGVGATDPSNNPLDCWNNCYMNIRMLNIFLERMVLSDDTPYKTPVRFLALTNDQAYNDNIRLFWRYKGEAYALRAWYNFELLRNFAGEGVNGEMLGMPLVGDKILSQSDNLNIPRASLEECIKAIVDDCDSAVVVCKLPDLYTGTADIVANQTISNHMSGAAAKAIKAKALLLAASPAYNKTGDPEKWEAAALAAAEAVKAVGGINTAFMTRADYYFGKINNTSMTQNNVILKGRWVTGNSALEADNYPVALYGKALLNVSQNLVDAFTDNQGYPISVSTVYNPSKPYANRDPRLAESVGFDGGKIGSYTINIAEGGADFYTPGAQTTRSGYYLKKALNCAQVVVGPSNQKKGTARANILIGLPEIYLMYAEAANQAWGVTADPKGVGFTAKQALERILKKDDTSGKLCGYLNNVVGTDQAKFNEYVRLQRRIELCFEGQYYYDLRRWYAGLDNWADYINVDVFGTKKEGTAYTKVLLEKRIFKSAYPPIPYTEIFNAGLVQNKGWK